MGVNLAQVGRADRYFMVDSAAGGAMVMTGKVGGVAVDTLAGMSHTRGRAFEGAGSAIVAGAAATGCMNLACSDKGRGGGGVAAGAVRGSRASSSILFDRVGVAVVMAVKVSGMAGKAGASLAAVDRCVAIAVDAINAGAVDTGVTVETIALVDTIDNIPAMAVQA